MNLTDLIKNNKIASIASTLTVFGMMVTGIWAVDTRYAKAGDIQQMQRSVDRTSIDMQIQLNKQSIRAWQDKIEDVEDKTRPTEDDLKKKRRWERQVQELKQENLQLEEKSFKLQMR